MPFVTNLKAEDHDGTTGRSRGGDPVNGSVPNTCFRRDSFEEKIFLLIGPVESVHTHHAVLVVKRGVVGMNSEPIGGQLGTACGRNSAVHRPSQFIPRSTPLSTWLSTGVNQWSKVRKKLLGTDSWVVFGGRNMTWSTRHSSSETRNGASPVSPGSRAVIVPRVLYERRRYRFERCLIRAVSSWTWSYTLRRSVISLRIFLSAYMTVVWSRPNV